MSDHAKEKAGPVGSRKEIGDSESSRRDPPHLDENMEGAPLQEDHPAPNDVPTLPATAHGQNKVPAEDQAQPIDPESMYDRRPGEDKDSPPSDAVRKE
jgi:hypothetical protein